MAKRKKRAATSRSARKKRAQRHKPRHDCKTAHDGQATYYY